jgi:hypothetical protein
MLLLIFTISVKISVLKIYIQKAQVEKDQTCFCFTVKLSFIIKINDRGENSKRN